jgi:hypothetical protein
MRITQYIGDSHNARTLIPMNIRTQLTQYIGDTHNARTLIPINTRTQTFFMRITQYIGDTHNARTLILKTDEVTTSALLSTGTSPTTESTNAVKS